VKVFTTEGSKKVQAFLVQVFMSEANKKVQASL
jgi:hypothetical protein